MPFRREARSPRTRRWNRSSRNAVPRSSEARRALNGGNRGVRGSTHVADRAERGRNPALCGGPDYAEPSARARTNPLRSASAAFKSLGIIWWLQGRSKRDCWRDDCMGVIESGHCGAVTATRGRRRARDESPTRRSIMRSRKRASCCTTARVRASLGIIRNST